MYLKIMALLFWLQIYKFENQGLLKNIFKNLERMTGFLNFYNSYERSANYGIESNDFFIL